MRRGLLLAACCLAASAAAAAEIAIVGDQDFDQAIPPAFTVPPEGGSWLPVKVQAWADPGLGPQALDAELLDGEGKPLKRVRDLAPPAPAPMDFREGVDDRGIVLVPLEPGTRAVRFRVRGHGPAAGAWTLRPAGYAMFETWSSSPAAAAVNGSLVLRPTADGRALDLEWRRARLGRLELDPAWRLEGDLPSPGCALIAPCHGWLLRGPDGALGRLSAILLSALAGPSSARLELDLRAVHAREFVLNFVPAGHGHWMLPFNQGLRVPDREAGGLDPGYDLDLRAGHFLSMAGVGWDNGASGLLLGSRQPADQALRLRLRRGELGWVFRPTRGVWRVQDLMVAPCAPGAAAWAQAYATNLGPPARLRPRPLRSVPYPGEALRPLDRLAGAVNIHYWKKVAWWNREEHPEALAAAMKAAGLDRALWSQQAAPAAEAAMDAQGWLAGSYENFQDLYPPETPFNWVNKDGWPDQAMLDKGGWWIRGWPLKQGGKTWYAGVRSSRAAGDYVEAELAERKARGQDAVFLDTTTATGPREDWNPLHPMTRGQDLYFKRGQLEAARTLGLVVGSESGHDGALGAADYFEGMQSPWCGRFEDAGYELGSVRPPTPAMQRWNLSPRYRAPLFDLVWHAYYVGYEYWGDAANRLPEHWRRKDLFSVLYAQPQLWILDEERWKAEKDQAIKSYRTWSPVVRELFGQRMTDWKVLDKAGDVQETHWEDGSVVRVDFGKDRISLSGPIATRLPKFVD